MSAVGDDRLDDAPEQAQPDRFPAWMFPILHRYWGYGIWPCGHGHELQLHIAVSRELEELCVTPTSVRRRMMHDEARAMMRQKVETEPCPSCGCGPSPDACGERK